MMRALLTILLSMAAVNAASADTLKVLTTGAFKPVAQDIVESFERQTGHKVNLINDTAGGLRQRVAGGEKFDVLVLTQDGLDGLVGSKKIDDASITPLAKVGIGVAVPLSAPQPNITNVEGFMVGGAPALKASILSSASAGSLTPRALPIAITSL